MAFRNYVLIAFILIMIPVIVSCGSKVDEGLKKAMEQENISELRESIVTIPVADAGNDFYTHPGTTVTLDGSRSRDADDGTLVYKWQIVSRPEGCTAELSDNSAVKPNITPEFEGDYTFKLTVSDENQLYSSDTVLIISGNQVPEADAAENQIVRQGTIVTLDGSNSNDLDQDTLTFLWTIMERPEGSVMTLSDVTARRPYFIADLPGEYIFELIVFDGFISSLPSEIIVKSENTAPIANAGESTRVELNYQVILNGEYSFDSDNDELTWLWRFLSVPQGSAATLYDNNAMNTSFIGDVYGQYIVELIVNDGFLHSDPDNVVITISQNSIPDTGQTACYNSDGTTINCPEEGEDFYGQDACYIFNAPSYTKLDLNGNILPDDTENWAMVRDEVTELIWEVKTDEDKSERFTWEGSLNTFIYNLNYNHFGGYSDWRMPTINELASIVDYGRENPAINTVYFPNTQEKAYWSVTTVRNLLNNSKSAWHLNFAQGSSTGLNKVNSYYCRAVRGGL